MTSDLQQAKHPVSAVLAGLYGHPLHPILVTVPIGAWVASLVFDVASHLVAEPGFLARGSLWLIGLGVGGIGRRADRIPGSAGYPRRHAGVSHRVGACGPEPCGDHWLSRWHPAPEVQRLIHQREMGSH